MKTISLFRVVRLLTLIGCFACCANAADDDFRSLFDGQSLSGWEGNPKFWRVEEGTITGQTTSDNPTAGNTFLIWREGPVDDFELRLKYRIVGGNSGIQYRSREVEPWVLSGYQADFDADAQYAGILYEERGRGILAQRGKQVVIHPDGRLEDVGTTTDERTIVADLKKEQWNEYRIVARGNRLVHSINGHVTVDVTDNQESARSMSGLLGLQLHAGPPMKVQFKDIQFKPLGPAASPDDSGSNSKKKIVFLAGGPSHGYGSHEHHAGCLLLARYLEENVPDCETVVVRNGWPVAGLPALQGADTIVVFSDGGGGHMLIPHLDELDSLMKQGVGLACLHYAVEVPQGTPGDALLRWIGGYFELDWSVNPHWVAEIKQLPDHPITRGVQPFAVEDEWYFHMRFQPQGVTPILSALPPASTVQQPDGPRSSNAAVRAEVARGELQHLAWAYERGDGGRGFGFTGGHWHRNWGDDNFRRVVLNGILWTAHGEIPADGVGGTTPTPAELEANQDEPKP